MDEFERSLLPAAAGAGLSVTTTSRHAPLLRRSVARDETVVLFGRCRWLGRPWQPELVLLLTGRRLVVTQRTRWFDRIRAVVDLPVGDLGDLVSLPDPGRPGVQLSFSAGDAGGRYRLWVPARDRADAWHIHHLLTRAGHGALAPV